MDIAPILFYCALATGDYLSGPRNDPRMRELNPIPMNRIEFQAGKCVLQSAAHYAIKDKKKRKVVMIGTGVISAAVIGYNMRVRSKLDKAK